MFLKFPRDILCSYKGVANAIYNITLGNATSDIIVLREIAMKTHPDDALIDEYMDKIQALAVLGLHGEDVDTELSIVVSEACYYLSHSLQCDAHNNLLSFNRRLKKIVSTVHPCLPVYKKTLESALAFIFIFNAQQNLIVKPGRHR
jgi:hypothetical protein